MFKWMYSSLLIAFTAVSTAVPSLYLCALLWPQSMAELWLFTGLCVCAWICLCPIGLSDFIKRKYRLGIVCVFYPAVAMSPVYILPSESAAQNAAMAISMALGIVINGMGLARTILYKPPTEVKTLGCGGAHLQLQPEPAQDDFVLRERQDISHNA